MLDLLEVVLVDVVDVLDVVVAHVGGHAQHLVVAAFFVFHVVQADGAALDDAAREHGVLDHHQRVQRIAVLAERAFDVAVVVRVAHGGEQLTVQGDAAGLLVDFVLVLGTTRDFNENVERFCHDIAP